MSEANRPEGNMAKPLAKPVVTCLHAGLINMRLAAFNTGPEFHALDHIAPLACLAEMPLFVTHEKNFELAKLYYPQVEVHYLPDLEHQLGAIAEQFDALFECKFWAPHLGSLFRELYKKEMRLIFCPHGQSDKRFLLAPYAAQDGVLLYGELLLQMLQEQGIAVPNYAMVGNYRLQYYQKHKAFLDECFEKEAPIDKKKKTLLYAPTWRDGEGGSSFFTHFAKVISELPADWNLIIKLHPLLEQRDPAHFYSLTALADKKTNVFLLHEFPPVYPVLAASDVYLGDASSVGYDFLSFGRPLYLFPVERQSRLHAVCKIIDPGKNLYLQLDSANPFAENQKKLYEFAFGASERQLREAVYGLLRSRTATCS